MRIAIGAIGLLKRGPEADLVEDYLHRARALARPLGLKGPDLAEGDPGKSLSGPARMDAEADFLPRPVAPGDVVFMLDEHGSALTSRQLADTLQRLLDDGTPQAWFLIGGADGHGSAVRALVQQRRARKISFGPATWPHMLVRAMLAEQLYRAVTIMTGHPYHRD